MFKFKLTLMQKLLLGNALFIIPVIVLLKEMVSVEEENVNFAEQERLGVEYHKPLLNILEHVSRHKLFASRAADGDLGSRSALTAVATQVDAGFSELQLVQKKIGDALQVTDEGLLKRKRDHLKPTKLESQWQEIKSRMSSLKATESNDLHTSLISGIRGLISHVGDTSNIILDPDLDSYYLGEAELGALPQLIDRLQDVAVTTEGIMRKGKMTEEEHYQLAIFENMLKQADAERIKTDIETAIIEDENFYGLSENLKANITPSYTQLMANLEAFVKNLNAINAGKDTNIDSFLANSEKTMVSAYKLWGNVSAEFDTLLKKRIEAKNQNILVSLYWGIGALIFATFFSFLIGKSLRKSLTESLTASVTRLKECAAVTNSSSEELVETSQNLSSSSTEQAAAIQETVATLNEINAMVTKSLDNAAKSAAVANTSQNTAISGKASVEEMIRAIGDINESNQDIMKQIEESNRQISDIIKIINEIGNKTKVINDIVFQTKLLSFNASVEAARAGEHGKGFAVVAEEVGNLAQMSGNAAKEISEMLNSSMDKVNGIVSDTKTKVERLVSLGKAKVEAGTAVANKCGTALEEIVRTVSDVNLMVDEISKAAQEQAKGVNEITKAMHQLDETTQQNADMSSKTAEYAGDLSKNSATLSKIVTNLEKEILGTSSKKKSAEKEETAENEKDVKETPTVEEKTPKKKANPKVVSIAKKAKNEPEVDMKPASEASVVKKAVGSDLPGENDPRFEDA